MYICSLNIYKMRLLRDSDTAALYRQDAHWLSVREFQTHNFISYVVPYSIVYQY